MKVKYDAMCKAGSYIKDGQEKTRWHKVGVVLVGDKGMSLKVESLPIGFDGWVSFFEPKDAVVKPIGKTKFDDLDEPPF
jgi:hypothetical protein